MTKPSDYKEKLIGVEEAETMLNEIYGFEGKAVKLPGETDLNFRISIDGQPKYILKVSRPETTFEDLDFQQKLLQYVEKKDPSILAPRVIHDSSGKVVSYIKDKKGRKRHIRLLSWIPGRLYNKVNPKTDGLKYSIGTRMGKLAAALQRFDHPGANRYFVWDIAQSLWTVEYVNLFSADEKEIIQFYQNQFLHQKVTYESLRKSVVHNDANDNNLVVSDALLNPEVIAAIDYGDAVYTQVINDLAIACAYGVMGENEPLSATLPIVKGYHKSFAFTEEELKHLYTALAMRLVISVTKSALNKIAEPDNTYLQISEKPAWEVLKKWRTISSEFAYFSFRQACGFTPHPHEKKFAQWAKKIDFKIESLFPTANAKDCAHVDLSVSSKWIGHYADLEDEALFYLKFRQLQGENPGKILAGGYLEPRMIYSTDAYDRIGSKGKESRTIHLGIDYWQVAGTPVHAFMDGEVVLAVNDKGNKEYGGLIILKHQTEDFFFYSLYGHLSVKSVEEKSSGDLIKKGELLAKLGEPHENGNWPPHLHFEVMLSLMGYENDFPGVAYQSEIKVWKSICPDPNLLFKNIALDVIYSETNEQILNFRKRHLGKGLSVSYQEPIQMVRGMGVYLMDQFGRKYLDTVNNVAHVGHEHPAIVKAGQEQMALLNTNSRYLHSNINTLARELLKTLPDKLSVVHFVNSGSEANELAIRMAKTATGHHDFIVSEYGYHGNSNACIEISSYKFDAEGGSGCPENTHVFPLPDRFRGKYRGEECAADYASEVKRLIKKIQCSDRSPAALIVEPIISCGGQIELPQGFLKLAYESVRKAGGLCISDEVQVGCGRMGTSFWGFQLHDVIPDIVTIGKPLGNGHPVGAVVCTQEVADSFANGLEYFNTFGGNPVSCAIAHSVLKTINTENLQQNAKRVGDFLKNELNLLAKKHPIIADVRGRGLFLGIELTDSLGNPLPAQATYLTNRMKEFGILMSVDGPDHNVIKIKPPLVFKESHVGELIRYLDDILQEDFVKL